MLLEELPISVTVGPRMSNYAILYRISKNGQTEPCIFCGASHKHGPEDGLRIAHCIPMHKKGHGTDPVQPIESIVDLKRCVTVHRCQGYYIQTVPEISNSIFRK